MGRDCRNYGLIWHRRRRLGAKTKSRMFAFCPDGRLTTVSRAVVIGGSNDAASEQQVPLRLRWFGMTSLRNGANRGGSGVVRLGGRGRPPLHKRLGAQPLGEGAFWGHW